MIKLSGPALEKFDPQSAIASDLNQIIGKLAAKDASLWGSGTEAPNRLNWIDLPISSQELIPQLLELKTWAKANNLNELVLCGMGGSSLAPEVIAKTFGKNLTVLDSTDPSQINDALPHDLAKALIIVGSKSGSTIETSSQRAFFIAKFEAAGLNPAEHILIITDPHSPLDQEAKSNGYRVINADPNVGGRYSALSAFGLTPATLMGVDPKILISDAANAMVEIGTLNSSAVVVATLIMELSEQNIAFFDSDSKVPGLADWIEQLIAESTGKNQKGRLPIVLESFSAEIAGAGLKIGFANSQADLIVEGTLGEQFIFWEFVTALLGRALIVDPFDQPNVTEAKDRTTKLLAEWGSAPIPLIEPQYEDSDLQIFSSISATNLDEFLASFLQPNHTYIAIMAYLNRNQDKRAANLRQLIAEKTKRGVTFGWGPRFLHSTGQFHKGGQQNGAFLQITGSSKIDIEIPGKDLSFYKLLMAQALGDGQALASRNYPLLRIHLKNREAGIEKIIAALTKL